MGTELTFDHLIASIETIHTRFAVSANKAVNIALTLRNWAIGYYIREFEQHGSDRATYGTKLINELSKRLKRSGTVSYHPRELRRCRTFYLVYPEIWGTLSPEFTSILPRGGPVAVIDGKESENQGTSPKLANPPERLVNNLSFSHFAELIEIDDPLKRTFYETECMRGKWSVRELKRQIASLYYERSGLSKDKQKLAELVEAGAETADPQLAIKDPYVFEFLGLKPGWVMSESDLEDQLLDRLQSFLLELGHGFCFEARQKRILIGDAYYFVDLVFYHRILKCHVLVELKVDAFSHEHIGQLNTYVSWYKQNMMVDGDNEPVGILLCTRKDHTLVEYALAGMDNQLFVSKYQLELPEKEEIEQFIDTQMEVLGNGN